MAGALANVVYGSGVPSCFYGIIGHEVDWFGGTIVRTDSYSRYKFLSIRSVDAVVGALSFEGSIVDLNVQVVGGGGVAADGVEDLGSGRGGEGAG
jgi:hypothetical protein